MGYSVLSVATLFQVILAYIDPTTGSFLLQLILGGAASIWVVLRLFGRRIFGFLGIKTDKKTEEENK